MLAQTSATPEIILIGTGSEVQLVLAAYEQLSAEGRSVRLVSMPSWELFERQSAEYRQSVIPADHPRRLAVEAGVSMGWHKYATETIAIDTFGQSAPYEALFSHYGLTKEQVLSAAKAMLQR